MKFNLALAASLILLTMAALVLVNVLANRDAERLRRECRATGWSRCDIRAPF